MPMLACWYDPLEGSYHWDRSSFTQAVRVSTSVLRYTWNITSSGWGPRDMPGAVLLRRGTFISPRAAQCILFTATRGWWVQKVSTHDSWLFGAFRASPRMAKGPDL